MFMKKHKVMFLVSDGKNDLSSEPPWLSLNISGR